MYITKEEFTAYAPSCATIDTNEFNELGERASEVIDIITLRRIIRAGGLSTFDADDQAAVKKAVCAQVQMMYSNGGIDTVIGASGAGVQSASIGKFSYSRGEAPRMINGIPVSPLVESYLADTELVYRGLY